MCVCRCKWRERPSVVVCSLIDCQQSTFLLRRVDPLEKELKMERRVEIDDMGLCSVHRKSLDCYERGFIDRPSDARRTWFHRSLHVSRSFLPPSFIILTVYSLIFWYIYVCSTCTPACRTVFSLLFRHGSVNTIWSLIMMASLTTLCNYRAPGRSLFQLLISPLSFFMIPFLASFKKKTKKKD